MKKLNIFLLFALNCISLACSNNNTKDAGTASPDSVAQGLEEMTTHIKIIENARESGDSIIPVKAVIPINIPAHLAIKPARTGPPGTNYYLAPSGSNSNNGLSPRTAWQSIDKINSQRFSPNDSILFKRGGTYYGSIVVPRGNLHFGAYGNGPKPVITGLETITGWVDLGNKIWEAPTSKVKSGNSLVLRDGKPQQVGRFPNSDAPNAGYLTNTAATATSLTGPALATQTNWTGAEVVFRTNRWTLDRHIVTAHEKGTIEFSANPVLPLTGFGYFFQRDSRTLDKDGEWYQDGATNKLRMFFANNKPTAYTIAAASIDSLFYNQKSGVTISDLSFTGAGKAAIYNSGASDITITGCDVTNCGAEGITNWFCKNSVIENCTTNNCLGSGIRQRGASSGEVNLAIKNCTVTNTALIAGLEAGNTANANNGLVCRGGSNVQVINNVIKNSGYNGIEWYGDNVLIQNNLVDSFCLVRDDGGGIYTREGDPGIALPQRTNRKIIGNIILNGIGAAAGTNKYVSAETSVNGIYLDDGTRSVLVDGNTIAYIGGNGIHGNGNAGITITNNVIFNAKFSLSQQRFLKGDPMRGLVVKKNIFYPYRFRYRNAALNSPTKEADMLALGTIDSNYYCLRNGKDSSVVTGTAESDGKNFRENSYGFSYMTATVGIEKNSRQVEANGMLVYNAGNTPKTIRFPGTSKRDVFGQVYNEAITLEPWSSRVLLPNGSPKNRN